MEENDNIVAGIARGDRDAERAMVSRYLKPVRALLLARTRNPDLASDLVQDVMVEALCALRRGSLRDPSKLGAFLGGVARNVMNNYFRTMQRRPEHSQLPDDLPDLNSVGLNDEEQHRSALAMDAIGSLEPVDRSILQLTLVEGLKPGAIARRLALSSDSVRQRKRRAILQVMEIVRGLSQSASSDDVPKGRNR
jgi:RNA polymerase sigma factor (sigma-70 family)